MSVTTFTPWVQLILYLKCEKGSMDFTPCQMTTLDLCNKVGVVSSCAHSITSSIYVLIINLKITTYSKPYNCHRDHVKIDHHRIAQAKAYNCVCNTTLLK